ncbi:VWA domain-containing protein [Alienimonas californiensis]|uniref:VWFA domain-containing protein n=1 Tax=Alienimonas californiensis TaxID=2527989 RepID=A0A517P7J8_9PLAN|nr:VWA domain-containing protein [Alienimonas californiensis]QDT15342.1 hypothetical protein CA12_14260 [Alienimonas californiensis]
MEDQFIEPEIGGTALRFVGPLPLWAGLLLAAVAAALAWRFYLREAGHLSRGLRWGLPALRSLAFALSILLLCAPVLTHTQVEGELGRVRVLVDGSESMARLDRHLPEARKVRLAEAVGRLPQGTADRYDATPADARPTGDRAAANAAAAVDPLPRWRRADLLLAEAPTAILPELRRQHVVSVRTLQGPTLTPRNLLGDGAGDEDGDEDAAAAPPTFAPTTDLATPLADGVGPAAGDAAPTGADAKRAAVVLLTDGRHNAGPSPTEAARLLGEAGVAVFPVLFGAEEPAADLAAVAVDAPDLVFKTDTVRGTFTLRDTAPPGTRFTAEIVSKGSDDGATGETVVWRQDLATTGSGDRRVPFEFDVEPLTDSLTETTDSPTGVGGYGRESRGVARSVATLDLEVRLSPLPGEVDAENNSRPLRLAANLVPRKALLLDGRPRWETRYLRNALSRDPRWEVSTVVVPADEQTLPRGEAGTTNESGEGVFPNSRAGLLGYDLIVYGELPPSLLTAEEQGWLREFVGARGGGLVFIDGRRDVLSELPSPTLTDLLPVTRGEPLSGPTTALRPTPAGVAAGALGITGDEPTDETFWQALPAPQTLIGATPLPGAEVWLDAVAEGGAGTGAGGGDGGGTHPAIVVRPFGGGRVMYLAFDETWRWRYRAADVYHQRLWNQLAGAVMPRPYAVRDELLALDTGGVRYAPGASAPVRVELRHPSNGGPGGGPATGVPVDAVLTRDGRIVGTVPLTEDPEVPGAYRGATGPLEPGEHEVSIRAAGFAAGALQARTGFVVEPPATAESADTSADPALLAAMAEASGGTLIREEEIGRLAALLAPLSDGRVIESEIPLWQSYWWFFAVLIPLTVEWILRKRAGLL